MKIHYNKSGGKIIFYESKYGLPQKFQVNERGIPKRVYLRYTRRKKRELVISGKERNQISGLPYFEVTQVEYEISGKLIQYHEFPRGYSRFEYRGNKRSRCPARMYGYRKVGVLGQVFGIDDKVEEGFILV